MFSMIAYLCLTYRVVMKTGTPGVRSALRSFFEAAAVDLELAVDSVTPGVMQYRGDGEVLTYTSTALLPVLTSLFQHAAHCQSSQHLMGTSEWDLTQKVNLSIHKNIYDL